MAQKVPGAPTSRNPTMSTKKKNHGTRPDLAKTRAKARVLIGDYNTPLRELMADIPAVLATAFPDLVTKQHVEMLDATQLSKPFSLNDFRKVAHTVLRPKSRGLGQQ